MSKRAFYTMPIVVFWDNRTGQVLAFKTTGEAINHVKSDFIKNFLAENKNNHIMAGIAVPVNPSVVSNLIAKNKIGMKPENTIFIDKNMDLTEMKEVFPSDIINENSYYYRVKKLVSRVGQDAPDTLKNMVAKLETVNLTRRKTAIETSESIVNRGNKAKERGYWKRTSKLGDPKQTFELLGDRDEKMVAKITKIRDGFQLEKWVIRKGQKPEPVVKEIYPNEIKALVGLHTTRNLYSAKKMKKNRADVDVSDLWKIYEPFNAIIKKNFIENKERLREQPFDIRTPDELKSDVLFEFLIKYSPVARASYIKHEGFQDIGIYPALHAGGFTVADLEKFLLMEYVKIKMKTPSTLEFLWKEINKNRSVSESQIKDDKILEMIYDKTLPKSPVKGDKDEFILLSDPRNKDLFEYFGKGNLGYTRDQMPQLELDEEIADRRGSLSRRFLDYLIARGVEIEDGFINVHKLRPTQVEIFQKKVLPKLTTLTLIEGKMDDFSRTELPVIRRELDDIKTMDDLKKKYKNEYKNKVFSAGTGKTDDAKARALIKAKKALLAHLTQTYLTYLLKVVAPVIVSNDYHIIDGHHRWAALVAWDFKDRIDIPIMVHVKRVGLNTEDIIKLAKDFLKT